MSVLINKNAVDVFSGMLEFEIRQAEKIEKIWDYLLNRKPNRVINESMTPHISCGFEADRWRNAMVYGCSHPEMYLQSVSHPGMRTLISLAVMDAYPGART